MLLRKLPFEQMHLMSSLVSVSAVGGGDGGWMAYEAHPSIVVPLTKP
jgi:hypothetical protein